MGGQITAWRHGFVKMRLHTVLVNRVFVLIHSPLVGPYTWAPVATRLRGVGETPIVPELRSPIGIAGSYWEHHVESIMRVVDGVAADSRLVLVAHSGAGCLLSAVCARVGHRVAACILADAGLPHPGNSRFETFEDAAAVQQFRASAHDGMLLPPWAEADLRPLIPDDAVRRAFFADIQPTALAVYEERMPAIEVPAGVLCGYLLFSPAYRSHFERAERLGWRTKELRGGHFEMLRRPEAVAAALVELSDSLID